MRNYLIRRLNLLVITAFILSILAYVLTYWKIYNTTPIGDFILLYFHYIINISQGQWGVSIIDQQSILMKGLAAFNLTIELCFVAFITAIFIALPLGIIASLNRDKIIDKIIMTIALISLALPVFWLSVVLTLFPSFTAFPIPIDGDISPIYEFKNYSGFLLIDALIATDFYQLNAFFSRLAHLLLPSLVLSLFLISELTRLTRNTISTVMKSNFIKAAYAKGFSRPQIIYRHVLKNAMPTIIHNIRLQFNTIISFAMVVEIVFSMQGIGGWLLSSIKIGDYLALPTSLLIISLFILMSSILTDILLVVISPVKRKSLYVD